MKKDINYSPDLKGKEIRVCRDCKSGTFILNSGGQDQVFLFCSRCGLSHGGATLDILDSDRLLKYFKYI